jgi:hypothetical protein
MLPLIQRLLLIIIFCWFTLLHHPAKAGTIGLGVRLAPINPGFDAMYFKNEEQAFEFIFGLGSRSFSLTGLYEIHKPLGTAEGLAVYYGGGAHLGSIGSRGGYFIYKNRGQHIYYRDDYTTWIVGLDLVLGAVYKIPSTPLNIGLDIKPQLDFGYGSNLFFDGGLSLRYLFLK